MTKSLLQRLAVHRFGEEIGWTEWAGQISKRMEKPPNTKVLGEYLRDFEKRRAWWEKHPDASRALAENLDVELAELGLLTGSRSGPHWVRIPGLPITFHLRDDQACDLGYADWSDIDGDRRWFVCPPGAGRTIAAGRLTARRREAEHVRIARLRDALQAEANGDRWLLVDVDGPDPERDTEAAHALSMRGRVWVFATFPPPQLHTGVGIDEWQTDGEDTASAKRPNTAGSWDIRRWAPRDAGWRRQLVHWLRSRIEGESGLDPDHFSDALDRFDPDLMFVATPGDVVALCAVAHERDEAYVFRRSRRAVADRLVDDLVEQATRTTASHARWLKTRGARAFVGLIEQRVQLTGIAGQGPLSIAEWASLLPTEFAPPPTDDAILSGLNEIAEPGNAAERRRRAAKFAHDLTQPAPDEAIVLLRRAGLLRGSSAGLDLHPHFAVRAIAGDEARRLMVRGAPPAWGRLRLDVGRRKLIDDALLDLPDADFTSVALRCLASPDHGDLAWVAAVEGVFLAASSRTTAISRALANSLATEQLTLLVARDGTRTLLFPRTLPFNDEATTIWAAACWRFSSRNEPPGGDLKIEPWLFPFWTVPRLSDANTGWRATVSSRGRSVAESRAIGELLSLAPRVVARCPDGLLPSQVPPVLEHAVLLEAPDRGWPVTSLAKTWWQWSDQQQNAFLAASGTLSPDKRGAIATALLRAMGVLEAAYSVKRNPVLSRWLWDSLPVGGLATLLSAETAKHLSAALDSLPANRWSEVASWAIGAEDKQVRDGILVFGSQDRPWTPDLARRWLQAARARGESISWPASILTKVAPDQVLPEALAAMEAGSVEAETWFVNASRAGYANHVLDQLVRAAEHPPADWVDRRLLELIDGGGETAIRAYGLWTRLREPASGQRSGPTSSDAPRSKREPRTRR